MILLLVLLLSLVPANLFAQTSAAPLNQEQWVEQVYYPATTLLFIQQESGSLAFDCTATAFDKKAGLLHDTYYFVTAAHCVTDDKDTTKQARTTFYLSSDDPDHKVLYKAKVDGFGDRESGDDFAVLEISTRDKFPLVPIGVDPTSLAGEEIVSVSVPEGFGKQVLEGRITAPKLNRPIEEGAISWTDAIMLQMKGLAPGSSGSTIVCVRQRAVCGIEVGSLGGDEANVAIPISRFKDFYGHLTSTK